MTSTHPYDDRMLALVNSFPTLRGKFSHWDALVFHDWACGPEPSSGMKHAARFILEVWNPYDEWKCGRFDWQRAMASGTKATARPSLPGCRTRFSRKEA